MQPHIVCFSQIVVLLCVAVEGNVDKINIVIQITLLLLRSKLFIKEMNICKFHDIHTYASSTTALFYRHLEKL